ncbi:hypothetical protein UPYG_G00086690 [Umbra pygmaea]|uniref:Uncharacterized protein n=1 Tax=Umbra pygmaea TaxID=75934 RepID=A0ABD0XHR6_UMBPY
MGRRPLQVTSADLIFFTMELGARASHTLITVGYSGQRDARLDSEQCKSRQVHHECSSVPAVVNSGANKAVA